MPKKQKEDAAESLNVQLGAQRGEPNSHEQTQHQHRHEDLSTGLRACIMATAHVRVWSRAPARGRWGRELRSYVVPPPRVLTSAPDPRSEAGCAGQPRGAREHRKALTHARKHAGARPHLLQPEIAIGQDRVAIGCDEGQRRQGRCTMGGLKTSYSHALGQPPQAGMRLRAPRHARRAPALKTTTTPSRLTPSPNPKSSPISAALPRTLIVDRLAGHGLPVTSAGTVLRLWSRYPSMGDLRAALATLAAFVAGTWSRGAQRSPCARGAGARRCFARDRL